MPYARPAPRPRIATGLTMTSKPVQGWGDCPGHELQPAESVAPPSPGYVRRYLRANLFDGHERGTLTVKTSDHLDVLVELFLDLHGELIDGQADG